MKGFVELILVCCKNNNFVLATTSEQVNIMLGKDITMPPIHDRIRAARRAANLSVNEFAKRVGVSSTAAWNWDWENTTPKPDKLPKIAQVLGVSVNDLTGANGASQSGASNASGSETLDTILADATGRIARLLGIRPDRVAVTFNLK